MGSSGTSRAPVRWERANDVAGDASLAGGAGWGGRPRRARMRLAIEQRTDVLEQLIGADGAVAVILDEAVDHLVGLLELLGVGRLTRRSDLDHVAQIGEQLLLDRLLQA